MSDDEVDGGVSDNNEDDNGSVFDTDEFDDE